jgi:hypothetical protein
MAFSTKVIVRKDGWLSMLWTKMIVSMETKHSLGVLLQLIQCKD